MKIGYSYWGYLGDTKYDSDGRVASTPDGNAFYSWSIIHQLLKDGHDVYQVMPDRDAVGYAKERDYLFYSWCQGPRLNAYKSMFRCCDAGVDWNKMTKQDVFDMWNTNGLCQCSVILHEWRMLINGRNNVRSLQPDYFIQDCLIEYCNIYNIKLIIFDLDYKLTSECIGKIFCDCRNEIHIFELGRKWAGYKNSHHVKIPFSFDYIDEFQLKRENGLNKQNLVYVGNRYERDWCIDKYIPTELSNVTVYGNWLESDRDSEDRWPNINFGPRLQTGDMRGVYVNALTTVLFAKQDYLKYEFMTARILEAVFYGCIPLFIEEYGERCIKEYAGIYAHDLTVHSKSDIINISQFIKYHDSYRRNCLAYLRERLKFMDVKNFTSVIYDIVRK